MLDELSELDNDEEVLSELTLDELLSAYPGANSTTASLSPPTKNRLKVVWMFRPPEDDIFDV